jgi:hypothetical protein
MAFPQILEGAIGLVLAYYVIGSVVSAATQYVLDKLEVKADSSSLDLPFLPWRNI